MANLSGALVRCCRSSPLMGLALACLLAFALQIFFFFPISDPQPLIFPPPSPSTSLPAASPDLQRATRIAEGFLKDPEDVCVDKKGTLYTAASDGWIKRLRRGDESGWENWTKINSRTLLRLTATRDGGIIIYDTEEGLLKVDEDGRATVLLSHVNGSKLSLHFYPFLVNPMQLAREGWEFIHASKAAIHVLLKGLSSHHFGF